MHLLTISVCLSLGLTCGIAATGMAQANSGSQPAGARTNQGDTAHKVQIVPTAMKPDSISIEMDGDTWSARGFDLKTLIAQVFDYDARRINFPEAGTPGGRYDVTVTLSSDTSDEAIRAKVLDALKRRFKLTVTPESRPLEVYVLSAPTGPGAELHRHGAAGDGERIDFEGKGCTGLGSAKGILASGGTMTGFSRSLEPDLDRLMIDETNLPDSYDFKIGYYSSKDDLFRLMHERLGLLVKPSQRKVTVLAVRVVESR